jgi:drug/metabolite transporter (DMT)-like permease
VSFKAKVWIALWAVYIIWGSTYLAIAVVVDTAPPMLSVAGRFICAAGIMAAIVLHRGGSLAIGWRALGSCVLIGCLLPGANGILFVAERDVPSGLASLIIASVPLFVLLLRLLARERLPWPALAALGVGFVGVAVLLRPSGGATWLGIGLCVTSSVMWALGSFAASRLTMPADPFVATMYEMLAGGVAMLPIGLVTMDSFSPSASAVVAWLYLVTFGSVVGYTAYTWLLHHAPLSTVSTYAYANPVVAIVLGALVRDEELTLQILVGAAIVIASVAVVVRQEPPTATQREEGVR